MTAVDGIVAELTLEEKASLATGDSAWTTSAIPRVGVRAVRMSDGPHGVRRTHDTGSMTLEAYPATCFPTGSCAAATWDAGLVSEMAQAIAREASALGVDVVLGPGANIKRSPLCGRNFEYLSEDPLLSGSLAAAWIDGIQSLGVGASLKHFAVNNQETRRMSVSAEVDARTLREIYLPAFEQAVTTARPWTVMCSYNRVNGTYASEHQQLLTEILRDEWGFDGLVVSDWAAVHDRPAALAAGLDLEMPGPRPRRVRSVIGAVRDGALAEAVVDEAARRVLRLAERAQATPKGAPFDADAHHRLARRVAVGGMVLLKNDGVLPLAGTERLAVMGLAAVRPRIQGGGSSQITTTRIDVPLTELARLAPTARITFAAGYDDDDADRPDLLEEAVTNAGAADVAVVFVGLPESRESEGHDRTDLDLSPQHVALIEAVSRVQPRTVVVVCNGSAVVMSPWIDGVSAVLEAWYAGQASGGAMADVLLGIADPGGRLAETFPLRLEDTPAYLNFPGDGDTVRYGEGIFVGYRWYDAKRLAVQFPFGHGLSYTTFAYGNISLERDLIDEHGTTTIRVDVTNTGERVGSDVVQVYVRDRQASVLRPDKELRGYAKVHLGPGETETVEIALGPRAWSFWDPRRSAWVAESGEFEVLIGRSSRDIVASRSLQLLRRTDLRPVLTSMSPVRDWLQDPIAGPTARAVLARVATALGRTFGSGPSDLTTEGTLLDDYFGTMPISDLLEFVAGEGACDPDAELQLLHNAVG